MMTFFITSTVMILAVLALRFLFKNHVSFLVLYPLWGVVLVRLLIPITPMESSISIMNFVNQISIITENIKMEFLAFDFGEQRKNQKETIVFEQEQEVLQENVAVSPQLDKKKEKKHQIIQEKNRKTEKKHQEKGIAFKKIFGLKIKQWAGIFWLSGSGFFFLCIAGFNILFYRKLHKNRKQVLIQQESISYEGSVALNKKMEKEKKIPIYITNQIASPCLIGVFYPVIYLTPEVYEDKEYREQVLAHERMHAYHKDPIWTVLRTLCQILYWFDPFVWLAAFYAKQDAEIACDEAVLQNCTKEERYHYGQMLIEMSNEKKQGNFYLLTSMKNGKRNLKERIIMLTKIRKRGVWQMIGMVLMIGLLVGCGLTGRVQGEQKTKQKEENQEIQEIGKEQKQSQTIENTEGKKTVNDNIKNKEDKSTLMEYFEEFLDLDGDKSTLMEYFEEFLKGEVKERFEWKNLDQEQWSHKTKDLYFSIQYFGNEQIPCLLVAAPFNVIMKDRAKTAMVYYYDQKEKQIELMTVLRTIGSGYPIQMNDGKFLITSDQHANRFYDLELAQDGTYALKTKEVYGYGTYDEEKKRTVYTYSEFTYPVPLVLEEGETSSSEKPDTYKEDWEEAKAMKFQKNYGYIDGADILFYHNTEKGWKKYKNRS